MDILQALFGIGAVIFLLAGVLAASIENDDFELAKWLAGTATIFAACALICLILLKAAETDITYVKVHFDPYESSVYGALTVEHCTYNKLRVEDECNSTVIWSGPSDKLLTVVKQLPKE